MKSYQPTFPWTESAYEANLAKLIETLSLTDTDIVIRLEDVEGLRALLNQVDPNERKLMESMKGEMTDMEYLVKDLESEVRYLEEQVQDLKDEIEGLKADARD